MQINVFFDRIGEKKTLKLERAITNVKGLLEKLGINPVEVIVVKNGKIALESEILKGGDKIKIVSVVSGG